MKQCRYAICPQYNFRFRSPNLQQKLFNPRETSPTQSKMIQSIQHLLLMTRYYFELIFEFHHTQLLVFSNVGRNEVWFGWEVLLSFSKGLVSRFFPPGPSRICRFFAFFCKKVWLDVYPKTKNCPFLLKWPILCGFFCPNHVTLHIFDYTAPSKWHNDQYF